VFVTNHSNAVELVFENDSRVILSPDDPGAFILAVERTAGECGLDIDVPRSGQAKPLTSQPL
jgi:hypothetical protein